MSASAVGAKRQLTAARFDFVPGPHLKNMTTQIATRRARLPMMAAITMPAMAPLLRWDEVDCGCVVDEIVEDR